MKGFFETFLKKSWRAVKYVTPFREKRFLFPFCCKRAWQAGCFFLISCCWVVWKLFSPTATLELSSTPVTFSCARQTLSLKNTFCVRSVCIQHKIQIIYETFQIGYFIDSNSALQKSIDPPVLDGHDVVQNGVDGGGEVVEAPRDVEQLLVDLLVDGLAHKVPPVLVEGDVEEALSVEGGPADEEGQDNRG